MSEAAKPLKSTSGIDAAFDKMFGDRPTSPKEPTKTEQELSQPDRTILFGYHDSRAGYRDTDFRLWVESDGLHLKNNSNDGLPASFVEPFGDEINPIYAGNEAVLKNGQTLVINGQEYDIDQRSEFGREWYELKLAIRGEGDFSITDKQELNWGIGGGGHKTSFSFNNPEENPKGLIYPILKDTTFMGGITPAYVDGVELETNEERMVKAGSTFQVVGSNYQLLSASKHFVKVKKLDVGIPGIIALGEGETIQILSQEQSKFGPKQKEYFVDLESPDKNLADTQPNESGSELLKPQKAVLIDYVGKERGDGWLGLRLEMTDEGLTVKSTSNGVAIETKSNLNAKFEQLLPGPADFFTETIKPGGHIKIAGSDYLVVKNPNGDFELQLESLLQKEQSHKTFQINEKKALILAEAGTNTADMRAKIEGLQRDESDGLKGGIFMDKNGIIDLELNDGVEAYINGEDVQDMGSYQLVNRDVVQVGPNVLRVETMGDFAQLHEVDLVIPLKIVIPKEEVVNIVSTRGLANTEKFEMFEMKNNVSVPDLGKTQPNKSTTEATGSKPPSSETEAGKKWWKRSLKEHLKEQSESLKKHLNDVGSIYKLDKNRFVRELPTLAMAAVAEVFPQLSLVALVVNLGLLSKNIGGRLLGRYRAFRELKDGSMLPPDAVLKNILTNPSKFLQEADLNLTDKDIENRSLISLMFNDSAIYKHMFAETSSLSKAEKATAIGLGILTGASATLAMQLIRVTGLPGVGLVLNRFTYRALTQTLGPRIISAIGGTIIEFGDAPNVEQKSKDWFDLAVSFSSATTVGATTLTMIGPAAQQVGEWVKDLDLGQSTPELEGLENTPTTTLDSVVGGTPLATETPPPTETSTHTPTPDQAQLLGWDPSDAGDIANLDQFLQTAEENNWVETRGDTQYYYLDTNSGPEVVVQNPGSNQIEFIRNTDGNFWRDYNGDDVLDQAVYTQDQLVPQDLQDKNIDSGGHLNRPALNPEIQGQLPLTVDLDGDGKTEIIQGSDGKYYFDLNNDNQITANVDLTVVNQPEVTHTATGYQIDKLELSNGAIWSEVKVDFSGNGAGSVLTSGTIDYSDGSQWQFSANAESLERPILTGKLANGQMLSLNSDINDADLARYQYELARLHPEWTPDEVGKAAYLEQIKGTDVNALAGVAAPVVAPSQSGKDSGWRSVDGHPAGELSSGNYLSTNAAGGWTGVVQGGALEELGMDVQNLTSSPDVFGNIMHRAVAEYSDKIQQTPLNSDTQFSDIEPAVQKDIRGFFNSEVMRLNFNSHLNEFLPEDMTYDQARGLVGQYIEHLKKVGDIPRDHFIHNISFRDFEEWLAKQGYKLQS